MKTIISRTALKTLLLYGAFSASICYTYCTDTTIAIYHAHQPTVTSEKLPVIASLKELHSWQVNDSLLLQGVLSKNELNLAIKFGFDLFYEMPIVATWSDHTMRDIGVHNVFSAKPARLGYAINKQEEEKIKNFLRQSRERRKEKEKKENIFELTSKAFLSKSDKFEYRVNLLQSDIEDFLPKVNTFDAFCLFDSRGEENVLYNERNPVDINKVIKLIEDSAQCKLKELALLKFSISEGHDASRERIFIVKQTDLMSTYITYRTQTDRAAGIDVLAAQLEAKVTLTEELSEEVESLKTEKSKMQRLIEEQKHRYQEEVTRLQSELQRQKDAYERQILDLRHELAQRPQITSGDQMMNMQSVPTMPAMSHIPYTPYSMQTGSRYTQNSGSGIQQRLIDPTNQRNEPMINAKPVINSPHQLQPVVYPNTGSTASLYASQCQMQRINHTTIINTQHAGQSTPYIVNPSPDIAMSVPAQHARPDMFQSVTENCYLNQSSGNETQQTFPIPLNPQSAQIRHMPIQSIHNRAIPGCYSSSNGGTASFNTPQLIPILSVPQTSTTSSQYDGQQIGYNGMSTCYPNSEYVTHPKD